jgi:hypothetical protein
MGYILPSEYKGWLKALVPAAGIEFDADFLWRQASTMASTDPKRAIGMIANGLNILSMRIVERILTGDPALDSAAAEVAERIINNLRRSLADQTATLTTLLSAGGTQITRLTATTVFGPPTTMCADPSNPAYYGGPDSKLPW